MPRVSKRVGERLSVSCVFITNLANLLLLRLWDIFVMFLRHFYYHAANPKTPTLVGAFAFLMGRRIQLISSFIR